jgi:hypothetical protein
VIHEWHPAKAAAAEFGANDWCLFDTRELATAAAVVWSAGGAEPGPYLVVEVFRQRAV